MWRPRLRTKHGCLTCRSRRKKCDESRPTCGACLRLGLSCRYQDHPYSALRQAQRSYSQEVIIAEPDETQSETSIVQATHLIQASPDAPATAFTKPVSGAVLDPFLSLPIPDAQLRRNVNYELWSFFTSMIAGGTPQNMPSPRRALAQGWLESMFSSALTCCALLSYAAATHASKSQSHSVRLLSLEFRARTERLIQTRLDNGDFFGNDVLLATCVHLSASSIDHKSPVQALRLAAGIRALIYRRGGFDHVSTSVPFSTIVSLMAADCVVCRFTGRGPFLIEDYPKPNRPGTMDRYATTIDPSLLRGWDVEVVQVLEAVNFALLFQDPAFPGGELSDAESWYIFHLHIWIDVRLHCLQSMHLNTGSVSEIATLTIMILKMEIFAKMEQHPYITTAVLNRTKSAVWNYLEAVEELEPPSPAIAWSCIVAASGPGHALERAVFHETLGTLGLSADEIRHIAKGLAWHENLNPALQHYEPVLFPLAE